MYLTNLTQFSRFNESSWLIVFLLPKGTRDYLSSASSDRIHPCFSYVHVSWVQGWDMVLRIRAYVLSHRIRNRCLWLQSIQSRRWYQNFKCVSFRKFRIRKSLHHSWFIFHEVTTVRWLGARLTKKSEHMRQMSIDRLHTSTPRSVSFSLQLLLKLFCEPSDGFFHPFSRT